jgi:hypothetical protein
MRAETSRDRRRRDRRFKALTGSKRTVEVILNHVRNGGSLIGLCETWNVRYSDIIAWVRADKLRNDAYQQAMTDRSEWSKEMILSEIRDIARPDPKRLYYQDGINKGKLKKLVDMDDETARLVREVDSDGKVKLYDRLKALELGARSEALLTEKVDATVGMRLEDIVAAANSQPPKGEQP